MTLKVTISITDEEERLIATALLKLGKTETPDLEQARDLAERVVRAGAREMIDQATGRAVPKTIAEYQSQRIHNLLAENVPLEQLENVVAALLKVPTSTARRLIKEAFARFAVDLDGKMMNEIAARLKKDRVRGEDEYVVATLPSRVLVDWATDPVRLANYASPRKTGRGSE